MDYKISDQELTKFANDMVRKDIKFPIIKDKEKFPAIIFALDNQLEELYKQKKVFLPNFTNTKSIAVFTDYSGEHSDSKFITYSFLISEYDSLGMYDKAIRKIRTQYKLDNPYKEIAFKDLHYGPLKRALREILRGADFLINGLLFTFIVDKNAITIFAGNTKKSLIENHKIFERYKLNFWKPEVIEKLLRIIHIISYLCALLTFKDQKLFWMTDNDSIFQNENQTKYIGKVFEALIDHYTGKHFLSKIGYATQFNKIGFMDFNIFLSLSDLIAGSISDYYKNTINEKKPKVSNDSVVKIIEWLCHDGLLLKKLNFKIDVADKNNLTTSFVKFEYIKEQPKAKKIYII